MMTVINFTPGARLDNAIARTAARPDGVGARELMQAAAARRIAVTAILSHRVVWTPRALKSTLPTVLMIGDDAGDSRDPNEWRCAISAIAWARCAIVHGTGAQAWHYREAIAGAVLSIQPPPNGVPHPIPTGSVAA